MRPWTGLEISCPYPLFESVKRELSAFGGVLEDAAYGEQIVLRALLPREAADPFADRLAERSGGRLQAVPIGEVFRGAPLAK